MNRLTLLALAVCALITEPVMATQTGTMWDTYMSSQLLELDKVEGGNNAVMAYAVGIADGLHQQEALSRTHPDVIPRNAMACIPNETTAQQLHDVAIGMILDMKSIPGVDLKTAPAWIAVQLAYIKHWPCIPPKP